MLSIARLILKSLKKNDRVEGGSEGAKARNGDREISLENFEIFCQSSHVRPVPSSPFRSLILPSQLAAACEIPIKYERLPLTFGRIIYLAEAFLQPPAITVNLTAVTKLAACATQVPDKYRNWFTETALTEIIIAHELYHILAQQPSGKLVEAQAHNFAQALTGLPFAPQFYEEILRHTTEWTTKNII